jgi:hypothetical protein
MTLDPFDSLQDKPRRRVLRPVVSAAGLLYLLLLLAANGWELFFADLGRTPAPLRLGKEPAASDPRVLHWAPVALPAGPAAVPYQAGGYEISRVLPTELTVFYRHAAGAEARVVVFARPLWERWRLLTPWPGSRLLDEGWSPSRLAAALEVDRHPQPWDRLLPLRLLRWVELRQVRNRVAAEDGGDQPVRAWLAVRGETKAVAREYVLAPRPGRRLAITAFRDGQPLDLRFAFSREHDDNQVLARAWLDGLAAVAAKRPDNQTGLNACENLPAASPNEPGIRFCRELYLLALWQKQGQDVNAAAQLTDAYLFARDRLGLQTLRDQLAPAAPDDTATRRLLTRVEEALHRLDNERRTEEAAEAATTEDEHE